MSFTQKNVPDITTKPNADELYTIEALQLVLKGVKKQGPKRFLQNLRSLIITNEFSTDNYDYIIDYILTCVVEEWRAYRIKKKDLLNSAKRGQVTLARKMAIIVIKEQLKIPDRKLSEFFGGRVRQVVYKACNEFKGMRSDSKVKEEIDFLNKHAIITDKVNAYMAEIKNNQTTDFNGEE